MWIRTELMELMILDFFCLMGSVGAHFTLGPCQVLTLVTRDTVLSGGFGLYRDPGNRFYQDRFLECDWYSRPLIRTLLSMEPTEPQVKPANDHRFHLGEDLK
jgi:hypothetical protein